jgi:hypothetical protein
MDPIRATSLIEVMRMGISNDRKIVIPEIILATSIRAGLEIHVACGVVTQESSGGRNIWGHDRTPAGAPLPYVKGDPVTRRAYTEYKKLRGEDGRGPIGRQGCGAWQLTWHSLQDAADVEGGCWEPWANSVIGTRTMGAHLRRKGETLRDALSRYNTGDPGDSLYSRRVLPIIEEWRALLDRV